MTVVVDAWGQVTTERMARADWLEPLLRWTGRSGQVLVPTVADTVAAMDEGGVDITLLSAWHGPAGSLISNEEVAEQVAEAPGRLRGVATVDLDRPMEAVREVRRWVDGDRFVGVRIVPWLWGVPPDDRRCYPVYAACVDAGVPFCTQIGHTGPLRTSGPGRPIPHLEQVLLDFPELVVVGGHVGFPWLDEVHSLLVKFPNLYVDTSAYAVHRLPPAFVEIMRGVGRGRVLFGTNWPMLSPARCLARLDDLRLDAEVRAAFLGGTAARVFGLADAPEPGALTGPGGAEG